MGTLSQFLEPQGSKGSNNWVFGFRIVVMVGYYFGEYMIIRYLDP